jgi:hypothetical protein
MFQFSFFIIVTYSIINIFVYVSLPTIQIIFIGEFLDVKLLY